MLIPLAYWTFLLAAVGIGWRAGNWHDRRILLAIVAANIVTAFAQVMLTLPWETYAITIISAGLLAIIWPYALSSERYWPVWFAAFQSTALVLWLGANFLDPGTYRFSLSMIAAFWSIPAILVMMTGLLLDRHLAGTSH